MLIFLHGTDTYRLKNKVDEIIAEYKKKYSSGFNLYRIDMSEDDASDLYKHTNIVSMFPEKRLIILDQVFGDLRKEKDILEYFLKSKIAEDEEVVAVVKSESVEENKNKTPGRKNELKEFLLKNSRCQEFKPFGPAQLKRWMINYFKEEGINVGGNVVAKLIDFVGNDLWQMDMEIKKLVAYKPGGGISEKDIEILVKPKININIFNTIDNLARKNRADTLGLLKKHFYEGENALYLLSMFIYQFRNIIKIKDLLERNFSDREISKEMKVHPYVLQKAISQAGLFPLSELKKIYRMFFQVDLSIKTGRIKPETALDLLVMEITK